MQTAFFLIAAVTVVLVVAMQTAFFLIAAVTVVLVVAGSVIAMLALRNAPEGEETLAGFEVVAATPAPRKKARRAHSDTYFGPTAHAA